MMAEEIHIISQFSDFTLGREYRLGVGTRGEQIRTAGFELFKGDQTIDDFLARFGCTLVSHKRNSTARLCTIALRTTYKGRGVNLEVYPFAV